MAHVILARPLHPRVRANIARAFETHPTGAADMPHGVVDDPLVTAAAADITGHRPEDLGVAGSGVLIQKPRGLHDLAGLADAA